MNATARDIVFRSVFMLVSSPWKARTVPWSERVQRIGHRRERLLDEVPGGRGGRRRRPQQPLHQLFERDHGERQRQHGDERDERQLNDVRTVKGINRICLTTSKLLPRSASDWMSALPSRGSPAVGSAAQPFPVELARVALRQRAVLAQRRRAWPVRGAARTPAAARAP